MEVIKSKDCGNGIIVNVVPDYDCDSPREMNDCLGTIYANNRHYNPDNHSIMEFDKGDWFDEERLDRDYIWMNVYSYEHGGIALSTVRSGQFADYWDSGLFGVIAVSKEKVRKEYGVKRITPKVKEKVLAVLVGEVKELSEWYEGDCYGYEVINTETDEVLESCYGYIGYESIEDALIDGVDMARCYVGEIKAEA